ncbi:MAG: TonB-dependent receptor, partial [Pseudomonadales bacterium]|nr:TonB-dependent receptor [Pseudomonadales bacterium]
ERGGYDVRQNYPLVAGGAFDPREQTFNRFDNWYGDPEIKQGTLFANFGADLSNGAEMYGWASYQKRDARSAGFYRRAQDSRNVIAIYADGFLPIIAPSVDDYSAAIGEKWRWGDWDMDTSVVYGYNKMHYTIENTLNASLGATSKTEFDAGGFDYDQLVFNFSGVRTVDVAGFASPLNVATGIEARREGYSIFAGEPDSYINGDPTKASGSQVFPGFQPSDVLDENRSAVGAYVDLEANVTDQLLATAAVRGEHYSDFGSNVSGKLAVRYDFNDSFALRGSISNGFRAPSLQQQYFSATSTNFISGVPFDIKTFPVTDPRAAALGAEPLNAEKSLNLSVGMVWQIAAASITLDAYRIKLKNRIVLSENLTQSEIRTYLEGLGYIGVSGGRFFLNGVDTKTNGVELVANWPMETESAGLFKFTVAGSYNTTDVTKVPELSPALATLFAPNPAPPLFGRVNVLSYEKGQPKDKLTASVDWNLDRWGATVRATRYGNVLVPGSTADRDFWLGTKTIVDLNVRYAFTDSIQLAVGADNLFDAYPPAFTAGRNGTVNLNSTGNTPFSGYTPYGFTGRFLYTRLSMDF